MTAPASRRTRQAALAAALTLATAGVGLLVGIASPASAAAATGQITGMNGRCIGLARGATANGTRIDVYPCVGDATIRNSGRCLDVAGGATADGTAVQIYDCNGTPAQQWVYSAGSDIVNPQANKCLDMKDNTSVDFTPLQIWTCTGGANQKWTVPNGSSNPTDPSGFVVSETQFNQMFPSRNSFYSYSGLVAAMSVDPAFARTGNDTVRRQEAAAFLANVSHETGGLVYIVEQNAANYPHYCYSNQPYGCPAGQAAYYGRGPIQLSWNFNYKAAGDALGLDLLNNPYLVQNDAAVAWKTGIWYWMTQNGPGTMTSHNAMVSGAGFGETIRSINGSVECNGGNPAQVQSRVTAYQQFTQILGVTPGSNLYC